MKVLIVDDEASYLRLLSMLLTAAGHEVHTASDAAACLDVAARIHPSVVVLDRMLGDRVKGEDLIETLRSQGLRFQAILMSGYPQWEAGSADTGVFGYLSKPFEPEELRRVVEEAGKREMD
ncbi:MAG: response regulator [Tepidisphaeraceae bacterium]|jgi:two-component system response regulator GlrR